MSAASTSSSVTDDVDVEEMASNPVPWMHGAAGIAGGSISMTMFYPLDFLRTRMHTYDGTSGSRLRGVQEIVKSEGLRGMYRGVGVAVTAHSLGWGTYLTLFRTAQAQLRSINGEDSGMGDFFSACCAACVTATMVTPLNLLKTRAQLHDDSQGQKPKGVVAKMRHIAATEGGWRSLFRGVGPQILLSSHTTVQVALYEMMKRQLWGSDPPPVAGVAAASAASKSIASALCNPLEVCRTRLQDKRNLGKGDQYSGMKAAFRTIWRTEGIRGLYRGVWMNIFRVIPTTVVAFVMYEEILKVIHYSANKGKAVKQQQQQQ